MQKSEIPDVLQLVGYHVSCIMDPEDSPNKISCSPHRDMPVFERKTNGNESRIYIRNCYMDEVAKLLAVAS